MKRILFFLLLLVGLTSLAAAEEIAPEFRMGLSKTVFIGPEEVTVTITVTNPSGQDMPGPLALYDPNGKIIEEFGTPTLKAGESLTWQGMWNVTGAQLNDGRVIFAVMYTSCAEDGSLGRRTQTYYVPVAWQEKPLQRAEIILKGNPTTGYTWDWQAVSGSGHVDIACEVVSAKMNDAALVGSPVRFTYVVTGVQPGDVEICFTYARPWEHDPVMALYNLYYDVRVDDDLNVTILGSRFDW